MKLWLDDVREMPAGFDVWCETSAGALEVLQLMPYPVSAISFDHDLGGDDTGYKVAQWIEQAAHDMKVQRMGWRVHSANPVGRKNISQAMWNAEKFWNEMDRQFLKLLQEWNDETGMLSNIGRAAEHPAHAAMVAMGKPIVGMMLRKIHAQPNHLFLALHQILGDGPEIPKGEYGRVRNCCDLWYEWGRSKGYIHEVLPNQERQDF